MKTFIHSIGLALFIFILTSCEANKLKIVPSGNVTTQEVQAQNFNNLSVADAFTVELHIAKNGKVMIETNENLHPHILTKVKGGTLYIEIKNDVKVKGNPTLKAYVDAESISTIDLSGASRVFAMDSIFSQSIHMSLSGASVFKGPLYTEDLNISLSGASKVISSGISNECRVDASGASIFTNYLFNCGHLRADLSGGSQIKATINKEIWVSASGASSVLYKGNAAVKESDLSGRSVVQKVQ